MTSTATARSCSPKCSADWVETAAVAAEMAAAALVAAAAVAAAVAGVAGL